MTEYLIYGLLDPRNKQFFYVGHTKDLAKRMAWHLSKGNLAKNTPKATRLREIAEAGLEPVVVKLQVGIQGKAEAMKREEFWMVKLSKAGHKLTNSLPRRAVKPSYIVVEGLEELEKLKEEKSRK